MASRSVRERSSQSRGGAGGLGMGGGGYLGGSLDFFSAVFFCFRGGGASSGGRGTSVRGTDRCSSTSTFSPSLTCMKLGDCRHGCVWTFSSPKPDARPCAGRVL